MMKVISNWQNWLYRIGQILNMLDKQVIFICGACGLLGRRFVEVAIENKAKVIAADVSQSGLDALKKQYDDSQLLALKIDINDTTSVGDAIQKADQHFGKIDALVNSAYPRNEKYGRHFFDVEYEDFCENLSLNLGSTFLSSKLFASYFKEIGRGNIINIGSIYGVVAPDFSIYDGTDMTMPVEYAAIKSGVIHLTKYMANYLKKDGVRVNCISPGGIFDKQPKSFLNAYKQKCGQQGMLKAEHLDSTFLYLISDQSVMLTGQNIVVDDGFTL